jgi:hypothetical protein
MTLAMAMVMLFAGCGGGSSKKSAQTRSVSGSGTSREVSAKEGEFRTIIPLAYENAPGYPIQYYARGPEEQGFRTSVIVVREQAGKRDIKTFARRVLRVIRRTAVAHLQALTVDGVPAYAVDYLGEEKPHEHVREVMVQHGGWVFLIRDFALPKQYAASVEAQDEVIRNWHWQ